jgi:hypothetical protein
MIPEPVDQYTNDVLELAAQRIQRQLMPLCVCPVHGGYDVQAAVNKAAAIVRDLKRGVER